MTGVQTCALPISLLPGMFAENLENDLEFKNIGYVFVTGMLGYVDAKKDRPPAQQRYQSRSHRQTAVLSGWSGQGNAAVWDGELSE